MISERKRDRKAEREREIKKQENREQSRDRERKRRRKIKTETGTPPAMLHSGIVYFSRKRGRSKLKTIEKTRAKKRKVKLDRRTEKTM